MYKEGALAPFLRRRRITKMNTISVKCPAKLNLSLDAVKKRSDGYHELRMIMQTVDIYDTVTVTVSDGSGITVSCDKGDIPSDENNICFKAAKLFFESLKKEKNVKIDIIKKIPSGAGMAGGSADAAGTLKALNELEGSPFSDAELKAIGKKVGADVPFCIEGGCQLCEGIGEILTPVNPMKNVYVVIVKPEFSVSTIWVYKNLKLNENSLHPDTDKLITLFEKEEYEDFKLYSGNTLEAVTIKEYPEINEYKKKLYSFGAFYSMMTGSGPTVFGLFNEKEDAEKAFEYFEKTVKDTFLISM